MGVQKRKTTHSEDELRRKLAVAEARIAELENMLGFKDGADAAPSLEEMVLLREIKRLERKLAEAETENLFLQQKASSLKTDNFLIANQIVNAMNAAKNLSETFSVN